MAPKLPTSLLAGRCARSTSSSSAPRTAANPLLPTTSQPRTAASPTAPLQSRAATYIHRPRRPYTFTQLVQLSDGSTFTVRTTSPAAMHAAERDSRNHILWQPSEKTLRNIEVDEAGKLAAFRQRFGRGFDLSAGEAEDVAEAEAGAGSGEQSAKDKDGGKENDAAAEKAAADDAAYDMGDLISQYGASAPQLTPQFTKSGKKGKK